MVGRDAFGKLWGVWMVLAVCVLPLSCVPASPYTFDDQVGPLPSAFMEEEVEAARAVPPAGPLKVTVQEAILMGMENNRALRVERLNPSIQRTGERLQEAVFDPVLGAALFIAGSSMLCERFARPELWLRPRGGSYGGVTI